MESGIEVASWTIRFFRRDGMGVANECRTLRFPTVGGRWCIQGWQLWGKGKKSLPLGGGRDKR